MKRLALGLSLLLSATTSFGAVGDLGFITGTLASITTLKYQVEGKTKLPVKHDDCIVYIDSNIPFGNTSTLNADSYKTYGLVVPRQQCTNDYERLNALVGQRVMLPLAAYKKFDMRRTEDRQRVESLRDDSAEAIFVTAPNTKSLKAEAIFMARVTDLHEDVSKIVKTQANSTFTQNSHCLISLDLNDSSRYAVLMSQSSCATILPSVKKGGQIPVRLSNLAYVMDPNRLKALVSISKRQFYMQLPDGGALSK